MTLVLPFHSKHAFVHSVEDQSRRYFKKLFNIDILYIQKQSDKEKEERKCRCGKR